MDSAHRHLLEMTRFLILYPLAAIVFFYGISYKVEKYFKDLVLILGNEPDVSAILQVIFYCSVIRFNHLIT